MNYTIEELQNMMKENGGSLDLEGLTGITALPDGLTVGGSLYLRGTGITDTSKVNRDFPKVIYKPERFIYCDGILTHIKREKKIGKFTFFFGKIKGKSVIFDGENYAHCKDFKTGVIDLEFKAAKDRGAEQYKSLTLDSVVTFTDAVIMYRVITGACQQGTQSFLDNLREIKPEYTVREIIQLTSGHYGSGVFQSFFDK